MDNEGLGGVTVSISGTGDSETLTDGNGQYAFTGLRAGNYTIEISGFDDEDVAFGSTQSSAAVGVGESKVVSFEGTYVRTSGIMGQVTADDQPQEDITVSLQGRGENRSVTTNGAGQFSFDQLRRGDYAVGISGYDTDEMTFDVTSQSVTVAYGETTNVPFEGTLLRTAGIDGTVTVEGVGPIANVTVTINGEGETLERTTDHMGAYAFGGLRAGDYSVAISGFDDDEYGFPDGTSATVTVELQETGTVPFDGIMLRTAAIEGTVTVGDNDAPLPGVMVTVSGGPRDEEHSTTTNDDGEYLVENLHAGTYSVTISGYDTREYGFDPTTRTLTVDLRDTGEAAFQGELLRTAGVSGRVHVGGMGLPGVTVTLTGEESREGNTNADGQYAFAGLAAGDYTLTISGWDEVEYHFEPTMEITLELDETRTGQNFAGRALRTATVMGYVTVEGAGLPGISVTLIKVVTATSGEIVDVKPTGDDGGYSFGPLLAGAYRVSIAGYDDELDFAAVDRTTAVDTDGTATVDFAATIIRTAGVSGKVEVEGEALADVEVTLTGEHAPEDNTMETGDDGMYEFGGLRKGDYTVSITKLPNADAYSFPSMSRDVNLSVGQDQPGISFQGELVRSAGVSGRVHVDGNGLPGVTVKLDGPDSRDPETTDANGQYGFSGLAAGEYTVTISGWNEVEYRFEPTMEITLELDESMSGANFAGRALRTATVMGYVTVEGDALPGVAVTLIKVTGQTSGEVLGTMATDEDGGYSFGPLLAGAYQVRIDDNSADADEHDFADGTTRTTAVETDGTASVDFEATIIRTAGVSGMVTVDGDAMAGVEVTLGGDHAPADSTRTTGDDGGYSFGGLRKGDYTVSIDNPDADAYSFPSMSQSLNLSVGQEQTGISFAGAQLRQASISGQVHAEGDPVAGVMVTLSGDADAEDVTDDNGEYNFPSLAGGDYMVVIAGWDEAAYEFATAEAAVDGLGTDEFKIVDFGGTHTRTASIGGMLFIDEGGPNALMHDEGEPVLDLDAVLPEDMPGLPITLLGPELTSAPQFRFASRDGMYSFGDLRAGTYVINVDVETVTDAETEATVEDMLASLGYEYTGPSLATVSVAAAEEKTDENLPFKITLQTINVGAVMGTPEAATATLVGGVELALYPTAEAADAGAPMLGTATTGADPEMPNHGVATFHFPRALDLGPGGAGNDLLVFAKVTSTGHADLAFSDNQDIEIQYAAANRVDHALTAARLVNVQVNFQWWAKSNADAKDGDKLLGGWKVRMGEGDDATTHTTADSTDMEVAAEDHGLATFSERLTVEDAIAEKSYTVVLDEGTEDRDAAQPDDGERWMQSDALSYTHNHLAMPADNTSEMNDQGPIYVTWTTQKLTLGVYREADDVEGFTDYRSELASGDTRPHTEVGGGMTVELMTRDSRNRLRVYDQWDHDCDDDGVKEMPTDPVDAEGNLAGGMITFGCLDAGKEFTVRFKPGNDREQMDYGYDEIEAFGDDLDFGVTVGAFGDMSGGGPEVRMCSASDPTNTDATTDDWCATFAYQWETGMVHGKVGAEKGHEVTVDPETGHGASGDDDETGTGGAYSIDDLQDGVYTATAASGDDDFQLLASTPAEVEGIALYHNEACWAATNPDPATGDERPDACAANEVVEGEDDDGETTYSYANAHVQNWNTGRLNLAIRGYVANDGQDGEDMDGLLRGDESKAGVTVTLKRGTTTVGTTDTNDGGFYQFEGLAAGRYTVSASSGSNYRAIDNISQHPISRAWRYVNSKAATAEDYTLKPAESDLAKPFWDRKSTAGGIMGNGTVTYTEGTGTAARSDKYYNFALVYTDGELSGKVHNLSGSNASIDIVLSTPNPLDDEVKTETVGATGGNFEFGGLIEAMGYSAEIEDAGYTAPCMGDDGEADDEVDDGTFANGCGQDGEGVDRVRFPTVLMADIEGENDHEGLGTFYVYNSRLEEADAMASLSVMGITSNADDAEAVELSTYDGTTATQEDGGTQEVPVTNTDAISWAVGTVQVLATTSADASYTVKIGVTSFPVHATRGATVALPFYATDAAPVAGTPVAGTDRESTITIEVTAENGYNTHSYTFAMSRAFPVGYNLPEGNVQINGNALSSSGGDGLSAQTAWVAATVAGETTVEMILDLAEITNTTDCGQTVVVMDGNVVKNRDEDSSACNPEYTLTGASEASGGNLHTIAVTSQDGKTEVYHLYVNNTPSA